MGVPQSLQRGGCGAFDDFLYDLEDLLDDSYYQTMTETKRHFARIIRDHEKRIGPLAVNLDFGRRPSLKAFGVDLDLPAPSMSDRAKVDFALSFALGDRNAGMVQRGLVLSGHTSGVVTSVTPIISDSQGEIGRSTVIPDLNGRFTERLPLDVVASQALSRILAINSQPASGRGRRMLTPLVFVVPFVNIED